MTPAGETIEDLITRLILEYAQSAPAERPIAPTRSIRRDLGVESLSLVSVALRLGEELGVDVVESGIEFGRLDSVGDLYTIARDLASRGVAPVLKSAQSG